MKSVLQMDIVKGNLDDISRPASMSRSRPGSRISSSLQGDKPKILSAVGSLEVLTPEMCFSEPQKLTSHDGQETLKVQSPEISLEDQSSQSSTVITINSEQKRANKNLSSRESEESDSSELPVGAEHNIDPRLEKAINRMKALDEILLQRTAKEGEVVAQSNAIRKQLWKELQSVSKNSFSRSHEENVNTNKFLSLTPQLDNTAASHFEKTCLAVFSTQLPLEECDDNEAKALQGKASGIETSDVKNSDERLHQRTKQKKYKGHRRGVDFIQRNIELVKEAGCHVLFMDDEKLRLEQLLADIQDGCSDDNVSTDVCLWLMPGEGYTPEPGELTQLAKIEAQLQRFCSITETNDCDYGVSPIPSKSEVSIDKFENSVPAPGEKVLCYTKELREQKMRLKEIDQQLDHVERSSTTHQYQYLALAQC